MAENRKLRSVEAGADAEPGAAPVVPPGRPARIVVYTDGPLLIRGAFDLLTEDGDELDSGNVIALCGCGRSRQSPFCDGSHKEGHTRRARLRLAALEATRPEGPQPES